MFFFIWCNVDLQLFCHLRKKSIYYNQCSKMKKVKMHKLSSTINPSFLSYFFFPAFEGQVLELPVLQIYIHFRSDECSDTGGGCILGRLVHHSWLLHPSDSAIQGQV